MKDLIKELIGAIDEKADEKYRSATSNVSSVVNELNNYSSAIASAKKLLGCVYDKLKIVDPEDEYDPANDFDEADKKIKKIEEWIKNLSTEDPPKKLNNSPYEDVLTALKKKLAELSKLAESAKAEKDAEKIYQIYKKAMSIMDSAEVIVKKLPKEKSTDSVKTSVQIEVAATMYAMDACVRAIRIYEIRSRAKAIDDSESKKSREAMEMSRKIKESAEKEAKDYSSVAAYAEADNREDAIESAKHTLHSAEIGYKNAEGAEMLAKAIHAEFELINTVAERAFTQAKASEKAAQNTASAKNDSQAEKYAQEASFAKNQVDDSLSKASQHYEQIEDLQENLNDIPNNSPSLTPEESKIISEINKTFKNLLKLKTDADIEAYKVQFNFENALHSENALQAEEALTQAKKACSEVEKYEKQSEELTRNANDMLDYAAKSWSFQSTGMIQITVAKISATAKKIKDTVEFSKSRLQKIESILASKKESK